MRKVTYLMIAATWIMVSVAFAQKVDKEGKAWLAKYSAPAEVNVNGVWTAKQWGKITLNQNAGDAAITGTGDGWKIDGVVSGKKAFLIFSSRERVFYSAELALESDNKLSGGYARGLLSEKSKTKEMVLTK